MTSMVKIKMLSKEKSLIITIWNGKYWCVLGRCIIFLWLWFMKYDTINGNWHWKKYVKSGIQIVCIIGFNFQFHKH